MSKVCKLTGKKPISGHNVSHSNRKTKRRFVLVTLRISTSAMRTINKLGVYAYVKKLESKGIETGVKF